LKESKEWKEYRKNIMKHTNDEDLKALTSMVEKALDKHFPE
jgi:hypothetical protein